MIRQCHKRAWVASLGSFVRKPRTIALWTAKIRRTQKVWKPQKCVNAIWKFQPSNLNIYPAWVLKSWNYNSFYSWTITYLLDLNILWRRSIVNCLSCIVAASCEKTRKIWTIQRHLMGIKRIWYDKIRFETSSNTSNLWYETTSHNSSHIHDLEPTFQKIYTFLGS